MTTPPDAERPGRSPVAPDTLDATSSTPSVPPGSGTVADGTTVCHGTLDGRALSAHDLSLTSFPGVLT